MKQTKINKAKAKDDALTIKMKEGNLWGVPKDIWHKGVDFSANAFHMFDFILQYIPGYRRFFRQNTAYGYARGYQDAMEEAKKGQTNGTV